jgi:hypothetical protein
MAEASFRSITLTPAGNDAFRVEIVASDNADIAKSQEMISLVVQISVSENPALSEIRLKAVRRAQALLEECMNAVAPKTSSQESRST